MTATRIGLPQRRRLSRDAIVLASVSIALVACGVVMVLSASSVENLIATGDPFSIARRHVAFALVGVALMFVLSRIPPAFWRRCAWALLASGIALQLLVFTPLGFASGGNRNWISLGGFGVQPSEFLKLALIIWIAHIIAAKGELMSRWQHAVIPIVPVAGLGLGTVMLGKDLGTVLIMGAIALGACFFGGMRLHHIVIAVVTAAGAALAVALSGGTRQTRIAAWFEGCSATSDNYLDLCWQTVHGWNALALGGVTGAGLGNSQMKWGWLPEANNDFIFAIIGEELGAIGAVVVLAQFVLFGVVLTRVISRSHDRFVTATLGGILLWVVGQAFVNVAVVLGMLPVLGVPLPMISAGGSSLVSILASIGVALSLMRGTEGSRMPSDARAAVPGHAGRRV
ncbi:peptidoglycan glycosyltransferase FtsW [Paramicrobacterium chengjingii]|uniref:peptidoglycan glycosyltransferase FtsW n=1 Tax=Paramicrobacterium chengjingii TaxID=2769067 RepID=UPI001420590D|nr:putative peptidoglycan glycosyltransferase FtsW [Microbacterium chengjingii]